LSFKSIFNAQKSQNVLTHYRKYLFRYWQK